LTRRVTDDERLVKARTGWRGMSTLPRMLVMLTAGFVIGLVVRIRFDAAYAALVGWEVAALTFVIWAWLAIGRLGSSETRAHATREDPSRTVSDLLILGANVGSLGADCIQKEHRDEHVQEVRALLKSAGIDDVNPEEFRRYGSARKLYNFSIDNASAY